MSQTAAGTFPGIISGSGNLTLSSTSNNTLTLTNSNTYTGNTTINGGTVSASVNNALPPATNSSFGTTARPALNLNNFNQSLNSLQGGNSTASGGGSKFRASSTPAAAPAAS